MIIERKEAEQFIKAAKTLHKKLRRRITLPYGCGLCYELSLESEPAYEIMGKLLGLSLYNSGIGRYGVYSRERENFLFFIAYALQPEDILYFFGRK